MPNDMMSFGMAHPRWLQIFSDQILQRRLVRHLLSQQLLQSADSSSSVRSRLASAASNPPNLGFHLKERRPAGSMPTA
jgi:hypothetical protein